MIQFSSEIRFIAKPGWVYKTKICICILRHSTERLDQNLKHQIEVNLSSKEGRAELRV